MSGDRSRDSLLRLPEVMGRTGLSRASIYRKEAAGEFPPRVHLGIKAVAWYASDIARWIDDPRGWGALDRLAA